MSGENGTGDGDTDVSGQALVARELRRFRERAGLNLTQLAQRVGYSRTYLSTSEKPGAGLVSEEVVTRVDEELDAGGALIELRAQAHADRLARRSHVVTPVHYPLTGGPAGVLGQVQRRASTPSSAGWPDVAQIPTLTASVAASENLFVPAPWAAPIYAAVLDPVEAARQWAGRPDAGDRHAASLRNELDRMTAASLASDYSSLGDGLPSLLGRAEVDALGAQDEGASLRSLSDVYAVIGWTLIKADNALGGWLAAHRATQAAEKCDDQLRIAAGTRCLAEVYMRQGAYEKATRTALVATIELDRVALRDRRAVLLRGAALLSAAAASARLGDRREAESALRAATRCADELGEDVADRGTVFGPTNVAVHRVAVAVELGDAASALRHADSVRLEDLPPALTERRSRFLLDVSRAYARTGQRGAALDALLAAERISADEIRYHRLTRRLIPQLLTHERRSSELRALAHRCGAIA